MAKETKDTDKLTLLQMMKNDFIYSNEGHPEGTPETLEGIYPKIEDIKKLFRYLVEILIGVGYLHKNHMPHGDLTMKNIHMKNDDVIIAGFDFTKGKKPTDVMKEDIKALNGIVEKLKTKVKELLKKEQGGSEHEPNYENQMDEIIKKLNESFISPLQEVLRMNFIHYMAKEIDPDLFKKIFSILGEKLEYPEAKDDIAIIKKFLLAKGMKEEDFDASANNTTGEWEYGAFMRGTGGKLQEYYPPHGWGAIGLKKKEGNKNFKDDESLYPIAYHGLKPGFYKLEEKISGIYYNGLKPGQTQDKKDETDVAYGNTDPKNKVGTGIFHNYSMRQIVYNQNVGAESVDSNKGSEAGGDLGNAPAPTDLFFFAFMCQVQADKIKIPKSDPTIWLIEKGEQQGDTKPITLLFKRANIYRFDDSDSKK